jgi:hypothetical protein
MKVKIPSENSVEASEQQCHLIFSAMFSTISTQAKILAFFIRNSPKGFYRTYKGYRIDIAKVCDTTPMNVNQTMKRLAKTGAIKFVAEYKSCRGVIQLHQVFQQMCLRPNSLEFRFDVNNSVDNE